MKSAEKTKKKLNVPDIIIIVTVILVILAVLGQDLAVYLINRRESSATLKLSFVAKPVEIDDAARWIKQEDLSQVQIGSAAKGDISGELTQSPLLVDGQQSEHLCALSGMLVCQGRLEDREYSIYGYGKVAVGDVLPVYFENTLTALEVTAVALLEE